MDFESPDVAKEFPGLYASESMKRSQSRDSDYSDDEKVSRKDLLGKKKEKRESKKDKGYKVFAGESSDDEIDEAKSPGKSKKSKSAFKFSVKDKKDRQSKSKEKEPKEKEKKEEKEKVCKKESKDTKKETKDAEKVKIKKKKESKLIKRKDKKKSNAEEIKEEKPIFGVPLHVAVERSKSYDGIEVPVIVRECIDYIEEHGLACEGIYRISGLKSKVRNLKLQYNKGEKIYLYEHEPHIVASLLKQFLRDLPEPLLTSALTAKFEEAAAMKNEAKKVETLEKLLSELPNPNRLLLSWLFIHMQHVMALERRNKMNLQNISIVFSPTMQISHNVMQAFFTYGSVLFKGVEIKRYVPPINLDSSRLSLELPDSPSAIAEELSKQENVLNTLHVELNAGVRDEQKEEKLWEIQRIVTQLKRKLRFVRQIQDASKNKPEDLATETKSGADTSHDPIESSSLQLNMPKPVATPEKQLKKEIDESSVSQDIVNKDLQSPEVSSSNISEVKESVADNTADVDTETVSECLQPEQPVVIDDKTLPKEDPESINSSAVETTTVDLEHEEEVAPKTNVPVAVPEENVDHLVAEKVLLEIEFDELVLLQDELKRKVSSEKLEIERLKSEINEYQQLYKYKRYSFDSTENSSSDTDDSSASSDGEDKDLSTVLEALMIRNSQLEVNNKEISKVIQQEREKCVNIKIQMKMLLHDNVYVR